MPRLPHALASTLLLALPLCAQSLRDTVSHADLVYDHPADRSEEGMPIGTGRMGSLVWTGPESLRFQINRVDVFAEHASSVSFPRADSDYASDCAYLDIHLGGSGPDVFEGAAFRQTLSVYDALMGVQGNGLSAKLVASPSKDVIAIEIDDERKEPEPVTVDLRMLRYAIQGNPTREYALVQSHAVAYHTAEHTATSQLHADSGRIALTQAFEEKEFFDASGVAASIVGRKAKALYRDDSTVELAAEPGRGKFTILISSAASFDRTQDLAKASEALLSAAEPGGFTAIRSEAAAWWPDFWSRGQLSMHSADGQADLVEANYTYFLYLMGSSSRGAYPPRFGGMLWYTNGDFRRWGSQYWWANTSSYYIGLLPSNRMELMDPLFSMYSGMMDSCALAAKQQWGSQGIWIPEITFFDGMEPLPDSIASELQDLMLCKKPYEQRSAAFQAFAEVRNRHNSRWNFLADGKYVDGHFTVPTKGQGIFGHCTHILGSGVRLSAVYWEKYLDTLDQAWLRDRAYPMIKGLALFYQHFPNFTKEADGLYHIHHVNNGESQWDVSDSRYELNCLHTIFPMAIKASEILGTDADLRAQWQEINAHLVALPPSDYKGGGLGGFVYGGPGGIDPLGQDQDLKRPFLGFQKLGSFIDPAGIGGAKIFRNRMRLREGPGAIDAENIAALTGLVNRALVRNTAAVGADPVLSLFNAWPRDWDVAFTLRAPGAFVITAAQKAGAKSLSLKSEQGAPCVMENPWGSGKVRLTRNGKLSEVLSGPTLSFPTTKGETVSLAPDA